MSMLQLTHIPSAELSAEPFSYRDPGGRLMTWNGGLYRGIHPSRVAYCEGLFESGLVDALVRKGLLVETERTSYTADGFGLILKHRRVPVVSYPFEWCAEMLRDAALLVVDLERELVSRGLTLQDGHSWNVLWDGSKPVFVDFGSIVPGAGNRWYGYDEFCEFFLHPLRLMAAGHTRIARWLMHDFERGIPSREVAALTGGAAADRPEGRHARNLGKRVVSRVTPQVLRPSLRRAREQFRNWRSRGSSLDQRLGRVRDEIASLTFPAPENEWTDYYGEFPPFDTQASWTEKHRGVCQALRRFRPSTVVDIGSNRGWFALLAAKQDGAHVVAFDTDEGCVNRLYRDASGARLPVLPLVLSFTNPSPAYGVANGFSAPATRRLRSDMVLALALTHHLVFKCGLNFEQIARALAEFTTRALVVEFVPAEDRYVAEWLTNEHGWYRLDNFVSALGRHFAHVDVRPSHPAPRQLLICES